MLSALKNPYVIGGAAFLGLIVLMTRGKSAPASQGYADVLSANNAAAASVYALNAQISGQVAGEQIRTNAIRDAALFKTLDNMFSASQDAGVKQAETSAGIFKTQIQSQTAVQIDRQQNSARLAAIEIQDAGLTARSLAETNARVSLADIGARSAFLSQGIAGGVRMHEVDVSSRAATKIASIQADAAKTISAHNMFASIENARIQGETRKTVSTNNIIGSAVNGLFSLGGSFLRGGLSPTSTSARPALT